MLCCSKALILDFAVNISVLGAADVGSLLSVGIRHEPSVVAGRAAKKPSGQEAK